jgi:glutathione S-transferase
MSQPKLTLYQYPGIQRGGTLSPPCGKVQMALRYKGLEFEIKNLGTPNAVKRVNLRGRVPALQIGETLVADSSDILSELEARFPDPPLEPADPQLRLEALFWEDWADECLYFYAVYLRWVPAAHFAQLKQSVFSRLPWPMRAIVPIIAKRTVRHRLAGQGTGTKPEVVVWAEFRNALDRLDARLAARSFLVGESLSRADLAVICILDQLLSETIPPGLMSELESRPALRAWRERVHALTPSAAN